MKFKILFIINPVSGVRKKKIVPQMIADYLDSVKFEYEIVYTERSGHGYELAKDAINRGFQFICAVGGDGSVHDVGRAIKGTNVALAVLPAGSGNGYARHFAIPLRIRDAIFVINQLKIRKVDVGSLNENVFLGTSGVGFDAYISDCFSRYHARGLWGYVSLIVKKFFGYQAQEVTLQMGEKNISGKFLMCSIANASEFGNGFCISPDSSVHDGQLELVLLNNFPWFKGPFVAYKFFKRRPLSSKYVKIQRFNKLEIGMKSNLGHVDGEPVSIGNRVVVGVEQAALNLIVGENYA